MSTLPTLDSRKTTFISDQDNCGEEDISVITYNILADFYVQSALKKGRYKNCPEEYVTPKQDRSCPRHKLLMREVWKKFRHFFTGSVRSLRSCLSDALCIDLVNKV